MITLALAGKPNCGKSTLYRAATMAHADIQNYPFTTIDANFGIAYVRVPCACRDLGLSCGSCTSGIRYIPINLIDVAGLVPDAHAGKGLGNQFLDNLRQADAIINVIDASGGTDLEGNPTEIGANDPLEEIDLVRNEMAMWLFGIIGKHWPKMQRQAQQRSYSLESGLAEILAGLAISEQDILDAEHSSKVSLKGAGEEELLIFSRELLRISKPIIVAGNKTDIASKDSVTRLSQNNVRLVSGAAELALRQAASAEFISYNPGDTAFLIPEPDKLSLAQKKGLDAIATYMKEHEGTGVQAVLNHAVFDLLQMIVVYPVEDENQYMDKRGRILPDAFLIKKGSNPHDLAFMVHSDIGAGFLYAVNARTKMRIKESYELQNGDIIRIVSTAK
ncbi:MAG: redox-regulated ATPase YchF [Methanospirillaceae archaeon]|nr:redox-regulated ATPase YchF [Methanospirillaceae archaeon]